MYFPTACDLCCFRSVEKKKTTETNQQTRINTDLAASQTSAGLKSLWRHRHPRKTHTYKYTSTQSPT